jgi:hypothetical protein
MSDLQKSKYPSSDVARSRNSDITNHPTSRKVNESIEKAQGKSGIMSRLFPKDLDRAAQKGEISLVKTEYEYRKKELQALREMKLQALQEMCNAYLIQGKVDIRSQTAEFMLFKKRELERKLDSIFEDFMSSLSLKYEQIDNESNPSLRKIRTEKLDKDLIRFVEMYEHLVDAFDNIVHEGV